MKTVWMLLLALASVSPAMAQQATPSSSPAAGTPVQGNFAVADGSQKPLFMTGCTAQQVCPEGCNFTVSCNGNSTCSAWGFGVTCDGVSQTCAPPDCRDPGHYCQCLGGSHGPIQRMQCAPTWC
jgi:hypothetical protein